MKWKEIAKAWLDGKEIQYRDLDEWRDIKSADALPNCALFSDFTEHRIKPKKYKYKIILVRGAQAAKDLPWGSILLDAFHERFNFIKVGDMWGTSSIIMEIIEREYEA